MKNSRFTKAIPYLIGILFLIPCTLSAEGSENLVSDYQEKPSFISLPEKFLTPSLSEPLTPAKKESQNYFFLQSRIGSLRYKVSQITFGNNHSFIFTDMLFLPPYSENNINDTELSVSNSYGHGYFFQQNVGFTFFKDLAATFGYFRGWTTLHLENQTAVRQDRQLILNLKETRETEAALATLYWFPLEIRLNKTFLVLSPYFGAGSGLARIVRIMKGKAIESERKTSYPDSTMSSIFRYQTAVEYHIPMDNRAEDLKVPLIIDFGLTLGTDPKKISPGFALSFGYNLNQITSTYVEHALYTGFQLSF